MNEDEALALKTAVLWEILVKKEFPNYEHIKLKRKGDPRKSSLFKYCYKLVKETKGYLKTTEYKSYMLAQINILKNIKSGDVHALIHPQCLVGTKAWKRWKLWKFKIQQQENKSVTQETEIPLHQLKIALENTKDFFLRNFKKIPDKKDIDFWHRNGLLKKYLIQGKISPYYIAMSPHCTFDKTDYKLGIEEVTSKEAIDLFNKIFTTNGE